MATSTLLLKQALDSETEEPPASLRLPPSPSLPRCRWPRRAMPHRAAALVPTSETASATRFGLNDTIADANWPSQGTQADSNASAPVVGPLPFHLGMLSWGCSFMRPAHLGHHTPVQVCEKGACRTCFQLSALACRALVRRPSEIFLEAPASARESPIMPSCVGCNKNREHGLRRPIAPRACTHPVSNFGPGAVRLASVVRVLRVQFYRRDAIAVAPFPSVY